MLKVHHLENSRSQRILWLLDELGLEHELVLHPRDPVTRRATASMYAVHPLGRSPVIEHDGLVLAESGAIIDYATRKLAAGRLSVPESSPDFAVYLFWLHYAEGSAMGPVVFDLLDGMTGGACGEALKGFYHAEIAQSHDFMEAALAKQPHFVASGFTAADINMTWVLELSAVKGHLASRPALSAYLARMQQRPAYLRAMQRGGVQDLGVFVPSAAA
jgi:glutathione S-transferase